MACFALLPRTQLYCSDCGENVGTLRITNLICSRKSGGCISLAVFLSSAARRGKGISDSAEADLIASHAPLRNGSHKARQNGPKHYSGDPTGAAAPLVCLSSISFFKQRKILPPEVAGQVERWVKNVQRKILPPEVVGLAPRLVNTQNLKNPLRNSLRNLHSIRCGGHNPPRVPGPFPAGVQARN